MPVDISGRPADIDGSGLTMSLPTMLALDTVAIYLTVVYASEWDESIKPQHNET